MKTQHSILGILSTLALATLSAQVALADGQSNKQVLFNIYSNLGPQVPYTISVVTDAQGNFSALNLYSVDPSSHQVLINRTASLQDLQNGFPLDAPQNDFGVDQLGSLQASNFNPQTGGVVTLSYYTTFQSSYLPSFLDDDSQSSVQFQVTGDGQYWVAYKTDGDKSQIQDATINLNTRSIPFSSDVLPTGVSSIDLQ